MNNITIIKAILALHPTAEASYSEERGLEWDSTDIPEPSMEDILAKQAELQAEYDNNEYQRLRKAEYDKLNQYEMMFDDQLNGTTTWVDAINAIKAQYPKPE